MEEKDLHKTTDAMIWAEEFVRINGGDVGNMIGWFANAFYAAELRWGGYPAERAEAAKRGLHPDEAKPRAQTFLHERDNWTAQVRHLEEAAIPKLCNVQLLRELKTQAHNCFVAFQEKAPQEATLFGRLAVDLHAVEIVVTVDRYRELNDQLLERVNLLEEQLVMLKPSHVCERCGVTGTQEIPVKQWPDGIYCDNRDGCDWRKAKAVRAPVSPGLTPLECEHCGQLSTDEPVGEYGDGSILCADYDACVDRAQKDRKER